ncbi:MAG: hypothetical protein ACLFTK_03170 [Anaerolineales bacterium]
MTKKKTSRPNVPKETLARARAELYGATELTKATDTPPAAGSRAAARQQQESASLRKAGPGVATAPAVTIEDLKAEYVYVISDLRNMGILAGLLFVGLIVAATIII